MPSLSALKILLTIAVTLKLTDTSGPLPKAGKRGLLGFLDVKRADFYSATRETMSGYPQKGRHHLMEMLPVV